MKSSSNRNVASRLVLVAGGIAIGYLLPHRTPTTNSTPPAAAPASSGAQQPTPSGGKPADGAAKKDSGALSQQTLSILHMDDPLKKMGDWINLLANANEADFKVIQEAYMDFYRSGGIVPDDFLDKLSYRETQLFGGNVSGLPAEPNGQLTNGHLRKIRNWGSVDPEGARTFVEALPEGTVKDSMLSNWFRGASQTKPDQAAAMFAKLPLKLQQGLTMDLADALFRNGGMNGSVDWLATNAGELAKSTDPAIPQRLLDQLTRRLGQITVTSQGNFMDVLKRPELGPYLTREAFSNATRNIAVSSPGVVFDFMTGSLPPQLNEQRDALIAETIHNASKKSIDSVGEWLNKNPSHTLRQEVLEAFVVRAANTDKESASRWLKQVANPAKREAMAQQFGLAP